MDLCTGNLRILLIDDEADVLDVTKRILERSGYLVTATANSVDALDLFRADPGLFDLVITDMTMPHMTGDKLARQIMEIRLGGPVILYTGYSEDITEEQAKEIGIREFVMKPSKMKDLSKTNRKVLDGTPSQVSARPVFTMPDGIRISVWENSITNTRER
jgi:CheY-like chemotaxis protein